MELLEGVLLAAQREYEERKVRCYGNLYANIAFEPAIDSVTANSLLREADDLSYMQIQLLALVARKDVIPLPRTKLGSGGRVAWLTLSIRNALDDVASRDGGLWRSSTDRLTCCRPPLGYPRTLN